MPSEEFSEGLTVDRQYVVRFVDNPGPVNINVSAAKYTTACGGFGLWFLMLVNTQGKSQLAWGFEKYRGVAPSGDHRPSASLTFFLLLLLCRMFLVVGSTLSVQVLCTIVFTALFVFGGFNTLAYRCFAG